jgi:hypothetical protein
MKIRKIRDENTTITNHKIQKRIFSSNFNFLLSSMNLKSKSPKDNLNVDKIPALKDPIYSYSPAVFL